MSSSKEFPEDESQSRSKKFEDADASTSASLEQPCSFSAKSFLQDIEGVYLGEMAKKGVIIKTEEAINAAANRPIRNLGQLNNIYFTTCNSRNSDY